MSSPGEDLTRYLIVPNTPIESPSAAAESDFTRTSNSAAGGKFTSSGAVPGTDLASSESCTPPNHSTSDSQQQKEKETTTMSAMEIDTPAQPTKSLQAIPTIEDPSHHGVFRLEDYLAAHKAEIEAQQRARKKADQIAKSAKATTPTPVAAPPVKKAKITANSDAATPIVPIAVGARSSKYTILLHEKYQALALPQPQYKYNGGSGVGWSVEVGFPGLEVEELQGLKEEGMFNSKQEAKEAASKTILEVLERMIEEGRVRKPEKVKNGGKGAEGKEKEVKEVGTNYVGQLLEFQRANGSPQPTYTDYQSGTRFACLASIEGHPNPFGSLTSLHSSKKAARQDAASHVVAHFKSLGLWPEDATLVGGIKKKKKKKKTDSSNVDIVPTVIGSSKPPSTTTTANENNEDVKPKESFSSKAAQLATALSLPTPEYNFTPHPSDPNFHSVNCTFRNGGPHAGPLGEVRNVFGKKKAKEECARLVVVYLEEVKEKRLEYGREMMRDVGGGAVVGEMALGRAVDGEGQGVGGLDGRMEEDEDEAFEDAVEEIGG
ncbi:hypothetical protein NX059_009594 [Plenodomus lindquistii]|nr:hypothetical protein NX059_009594 [Plenodomus lindquistii]